MTQSFAHFAIAHQDLALLEVDVGADDLSQLSDRGSQNLSEEEEEGGKGLVLGGGADVSVYGEMAKEGVDILFAEGFEGSPESLQRLVERIVAARVA